MEGQLVAKNKLICGLQIQFLPTSLAYGCKNLCELVHRYDSMVEPTAICEVDCSLRIQL